MSTPNAPIICIKFRALELSHHDKTARDALFFWQAASELRAALAANQRPLVRAILALHAMAETAALPVAERAGTLLAEQVKAMEAAS